jgi:ABC-2 type transport system permease protein
MSGLWRLLAVAAKEVRQLARDRITIGLIVGIPTIQLLLFGYAINFDVRGVSAAVLDQSRTSLSRRLLGDLAATQVLGALRQAVSERELRELMQKGEANVGIVIAPDIERRLADGDRAVMQILVDGSQPALENVAQGLGAMPLLQRRGTPAAARPVEILVAYNPEKRTAVQIVPALCGVILTMTMVIFTASAIVRERERGNLELLITTPVSPAELMAGKLLPYDVKVTTVCPALTATDFFDVSENGRKAKSSFVNLKKMTQPQTVAGRIVATVGRNKPELVFTLGGKFLVVLNALWPRAADRIMKVYHDDLAKRLT